MSVTLEQIASYYDTRSQRMLGDFVRGNPRITAAIDLVTDTLKDKSGTLLDIGCGIGTSCHYYAKKLPGMRILGTDISPNNIDIAQRLFTEERVNFATSSMTAPPSEGPFDAIALIDVYEHIPRSDWPGFNSLLAQCLAPNGTLILTTPSWLHQEYLATYKPEGLQIIDETVMLSDLIELGRELNASITYYRLVNVFNANSYLHVVFQRSVEYENPTCSNSLPVGVMGKAARKLKRIGERLYDQLTSSREVARRKKYVYERLGIEIH